jgi:hypothetical protein
MPEKEFEEMQGKVASMESKLDQLESELVYVNHLLLEVGFPDGVQGLKEALEEVLKFEDNTG